MKLTLRKAHAITKKLQSVQTGGVLGVSIDGTDTAETITQTLTDVSAKNKAEVLLRLSIVQAIYAIRSRIQKQNATEQDFEGTAHSIDSLLNDKVSIELQLSHLNQYSSLAEIASDESTVKALMVSIAREEKAYSRSMTSINGLAAADKAELRDLYYSTKQQLEAVVDKLAVLNNTFTVELTSDEEELLKTLRII